MNDDLLHFLSVESNLKKKNQAVVTRYFVALRNMYLIPILVVLLWSTQCENMKNQYVAEAARNQADDQSSPSLTSA